MDENTVATEMLPIAVRAARRLWRDPEAESVAGEACIKAIRSFDGRGTLEGHVRYCVRVHIYHTWRKVRVRSAVEYTEHLEHVAAVDPPYSESALTAEEWCILCEKFELRWPFDVVAKRHGVSTRYMKRLIPTLIAKLEASL